MKFRVMGVVVFGLCSGVSLNTTAEAHMQDYLVSKPYDTASRGEFEVELRNDVNFPEADNDDSYNSQHQIELEYGVTDHLQMSYYEVYTWDRANDWQRQGLKIEAKLRFAKAGQWPVDLALYTEYENPNGRRRAHSDTLENKVILSKDIGPWNLIGNFTFEKELNNGNPWEFEYTAGVSYALTALARVGLELKQGLGDSDEFHFGGHEPLYLVPGVYVSLTPHIRVAAGPAFGLTRVSDDLQLKSIVEIEF